MLTLYKTTDPKGVDSYYAISEEGNTRCFYEDVLFVGVIEKVICAEIGQPLKVIVFDGNIFQAIATYPVTKIYPPRPNT